MIAHPERLGMLKELNFDDTVEIDTSGIKSDTVTVMIEGAMGGGKLELFAKGEVVIVPIADGGPFDDMSLDAFGKPIRRIVISGRQKAILVKLMGSDGSADLRIEVQ